MIKELIITFFIFNNSLVTESSLVRVVRRVAREEGVTARIRHMGTKERISGLKKCPESCGFEISCPVLYGKGDRTVFLSKPGRFAYSDSALDYTGFFNCRAGYLPVSDGTIEDVKTRLRKFIRKFKSKECKGKLK